MYIVVTFTIKKKTTPTKTKTTSACQAQGFLLMWIVCNLFYVVYANSDTIIDT